MLVDRMTVDGVVVKLAGLEQREVRLADEEVIVVGNHAGFTKPLNSVLPPEESVDLPADLWRRKVVVFLPVFLQKHLPDPVQDLSIPSLLDGDEVVFIEEITDQP